MVTMSQHFLEEADPKMQYYLVTLFKGLNFSLGEEGYAILSKLLKESKDQKVQQALLDCVISRIKLYHDDQAIEVLLTNYDNFDSWQQEQIKQKVPEILSGYISRYYKGSISHTTLLAEILGISEGDLNQTLSFLKEINDNPLSYSYHPGYFNDYVRLAKTPGFLQFLKRLTQYGYYFMMEDADALLEMSKNQEEIFSALEEIKNYFPNFQYTIDRQNKYDLQGIKTIFISDPYEILSSRYSPAIFLKALASKQIQEGTFSRKFSDGFMRSLRRGDPLLQKDLQHFLDIDESHLQSFYEALQALIGALYRPDGQLVDYREYFQNKNLLRYVARRPERIEDVIGLPQSVPEFFQLIQPGGPLYTNRDNILRDIFANADILRRCREVATVFTKKVPYWKLLFLFTNTRIGDKLTAADTQYPITEIRGIPLATIVRRHKKVKDTNPDQITTLESIIKDADVRNKLIAGEIQAVPFSAISGMYKRVIFRDYLRKTIETSRATEVKNKSDLKNKENASPTLTLKAGTYIHGSPIDQIESVLLNGNLPREALGEGAETDAYPFHVDFTRLGQTFLDDKKTEKILLESLSGGYGIHGSLGVKGQIFYIYDRETTEWEQGKEYGPSSHHALILGGMPATEISAIVLRNPESTLARAKKAVLENGFYIPIYDINGQLVFTPEEYERSFENLNLQVPVEVWDFSLKTGGQLGSNPGGEFTVPTKEGPVKHYVKFSRAENTDHLWNEQLADNIYRKLGLRVPETKVVRVEGAYGHASKIITGASEGAGNDLKNGFIADVLLANWDIVANPGNTINVQGITYRIDNGGALLFRAQGERKENFGSVVEELKTMKDRYLNLTNEDIKQQVEDLKEKLRDEVIDELVDGVRLSKKDRNFLKKTLKERRDYIINNASLILLETSTQI